MSDTKVTPSEAETRLILALINSSTLSNIPWATVATDLNLSNQAAQKRWTRFKAKLGGAADKTASPAEVELLLSIVRTVQLSGIGWPAVASELGVNVQAAQKRWTRFKAKLPTAANVGGPSLNSGEGLGSGGSASGKKAGGGKVNGKITAKKTSPKKRQASDSEDEEVAAEGGPVGGSAKKRVKSEKGGSQSVREEINDRDHYDELGGGQEREDDSEDQYDELGEGPEREDEFYDAECGYYGEGEEI